MWSIFPQLDPKRSTGWKTVGPAADLHTCHSCCSININSLLCWLTAGLIDWLINWVNILYPSWYKSGHVREVFHSQSQYWCSTRVIIIIMMIHQKSEDRSQWRRGSDVPRQQHSWQLHRGTVPRPGLTAVWQHSASHTTSHAVTVTVTQRTLIMLHRQTVCRY